MSRRVAATAVALAVAFAGIVVAATRLSGSEAATPPSEPTAGQWATWLLRSASQIPVAPPPDEGSAAAARDGDGARRAAADRSEADLEAVQRWERNPAMAPWMERTMQAVAQRPKDPPYSSRAYGLVAVAMYDAVISASYWRQRYRRPPPEVDRAVEVPAEPSYPDTHAAIAGAASRVIARLFPEQPRAALERDAEEAASSRVSAGVAYPSDVAAGLRLGREVAERAIARAETDGADRRWDGERPPRTPAYYDAPPGTAARPVQPLAGAWRTWLIGPAERFRASPPPPYGSPPFRRALRAVIAAKENLTEEQRRAARFWAGGEGTPLPPGIWEGVLIEYLSERELSTPRAARAFALTSVAMADAGIVAWETKYAYWYPRPENAIRDAGVDPGWDPLIATPFFPAYTSGHAAYSGAAAEVLSHLFPEHAEDWRDRAEEAAASRVWGGIHWPFDGTAGLKQGVRVGRVVIEHARDDGADR